MESLVGDAVVRVEYHGGNVSRACHRRRRRRVAEPGEEVVGGGAAGAVPDLDVVEAAVLVTLDAERREVELNGNGHFCLWAIFSRIFGAIF